MHRRSVIYLVHQLGAFRASDIGSVELAVIHAHFSNILAPSIAIKPAIKHLNGHAGLLFFTEVGVNGSFDAVAVKIHGIGTVLSGTLRRLPTEIGMHLRERDDNAVSDSVDLGLFVVIPIGVGRGALWCHQEACSVAKCPGHISKVGGFPYRSAQIRVVVVYLPIARITCFQLVILVLVYPNELQAAVALCLGLHVVYNPVGGDGVAFFKSHLFGGGRQARLAVLAHLLC